jgi:hypothetical protein
VTTVIQGELVKMVFDGRVTSHAIGGRVEVRGGPMAGRYDWTSQREVAGTDNTPPAERSADGSARRAIRALLRLPSVMVGCQG